VADTETITLNFDGSYVGGATNATNASAKLIDVLDRLSNSLEHGKGAAKGHGASLIAIKDPAEIARHALDGVASGVKGMVSALAGGDAKGAIEGATEAVAGLASALDYVVPGLGQAAAAAVKVAGAFVGLIAGGVETALEVRAMNAQLEATFDALGSGPDAGKHTLDLLDDMKRDLPQTRDELAKWTRAIEKMGVTDLGQVRRELLATASAQAILGEEGPAAFEKIERKIHDAIDGHHALKIASKELTRTIGTNLAGAAAARMGLTLEQLEVKLKAGTVDAAKFGDALEDALIAKGAKGLDALWASKAWSKIKESGRELFADVDVTPITGAMRDLLVLFDQTQPSGQAMKVTITDAFNGIVKAIGWAITEGEVLALRFMVYGLSMELALLPVWNVLKKIGGALEGAGQAIGLVAKPGAAPAPVAPKDAGASAVDAVGSTMSGITGFLLGGPLGAAMTIGGKKVGDAISEGLVNALRGGKPDVEAAANDLGATAIVGTKRGAGVKSPSKPAIEIGGYVAEGLGIGMTSSPAPARAGRRLSANALGGLVGAALTSPAANGNGGGGLTLHVENINITAPHGVTDATGLTATGLAVAVERFQLASGR
jgi:hypothetical protein